MVVSVRSADDEGMTEFVVGVLQSAGFAPNVDGNHVVLEGAGVGLGDHSVDLVITVLSIDDVRIVHFESTLRSHPGTFEAAVLAAARGNGACVVPKFEVVEDSSITSTARFRIKATLNLYADHVSEEEFRVMLHLFLKEVDAIDNELADIVSERGRIT
jgi:hypothetical protein